jgi:hypothetical protein
MNSKERKTQDEPKNPRSSRWRGGSQKMRLVQMKLELKLGVLGHTYNPSIPQAVERWGGVWGQPGLHHKELRAKKAAGDCVHFLI